MIREILERARQGHRTTEWPDGDAPPLPPRFRGLPAIDASRCPAACRVCEDACPTRAITVSPGAVVAPSGSRLATAGPGSAPADPRIDLGACLFCTDCVEACPEGAIEQTADYRLASRTREGLVVGAGRQRLLATALDGELRRLFGRSLKLRQVSAGGCNACEADVNVLSTIAYDLGRFGIQVVASPRHADGLLITGPVTQNMRLALVKTYQAVPSPKIVIAVGACAIAGGPYAGHPEVADGAVSVVPVDLFVPGCPPHPLTILDGLLSLLGHIAAE